MPDGMLLQVDCCLCFHQHEHGTGRLIVDCCFVVLFSPWRFVGCLFFPCILTLFLSFFGHTHRFIATFLWLIMGSTMVLWPAVAAAVFTAASNHSSQQSQQPVVAAVIVLVSA